MDRPGGTGWVSRWVDLSGPVHYLDFGGPADGPIVVGVHGLGGSSLNWCAIAPLLVDRCRLMALDLAGHGLTESLGRRTTVRANRELLHRFIEAVPGRPVILMGNSMGGMLALLEAAAEVQVAVVLGLCCVDRSRVPAEVVAEHVDLARRRRRFAHVERDFLYAARSVVATAGLSRGGAYRRAIRSIRGPALLIHGERDRLVPVAASRAIAREHPSWPLVTLPDVGHVPQLEAPRATAEAILGWLDDAGREAVGAAVHPLAVAG